MRDLNLYGRHAHDFELTFSLSDMILGNQDLNREENLEKHGLAFGRSLYV